ncbi:MAG: UDP-N-acetylmuramoyl-L-alanyl-D-glutamate--2,6-diaminopimelate ligase [Pseudomonadales bacterium]|nr:UDP-N-acetylmuramoyl-L-alanyl-D-glutamate--2,6-diaminopimelate ligase [Pseudomonadales bacterium]
MNTAKIMSRPICLSELLGTLLAVPENFDVQITGMEMDSRKLVAGDVFLACKGASFDGREFIDDAVARGARAIIVEKDTQWSQASLRHGVPILPVDKLSSKIGKIAARYFGHPGRGMTLIGITGTNGKTSCCQFIAQCFSALAGPCGVSGTLGYGIYGDTCITDENGPATTPDAVAVQRIMQEARSRNAQCMVMEVSSHGLEQNRVNVCEFDVALFTNLSQEHLDYHGDMKAYGEAKRKLFLGPDLRIAIVNQDDNFSASILNSISRQVKSYTYSLKNSHASVFLRELVFTRTGFMAEIFTPWGNGPIKSQVLGSFNVSNLLAAVTTVMAVEAQKQDFDFLRVLAAIERIKPVAGRMEIIPHESLAVVVDYAHTPDGLSNALSALKEHFHEGKIWCVFGCGGNRDRSKRPLMAEIAEAMADHLVITDDNPRNERSEDIIKQILGGIRKKEKTMVISDRASAIEYAITQAEAGDVVLIAGKGHEQYQDIGGSRMAFSDVKQARISLNKRGQQILAKES